MSDRSAIEWTRSDDGTAGATWNPLRAGSGGRWYCEKLSPGCQHCYSSTFNGRLGGMTFPNVGELGTYQRHGLNPVYLDEKALTQPHHWARPRRIFVCSMTDLFGEWVPDDQIDQVFAAMVAEPRHTFILLTKRPTHMVAWWNRSTYARWLGKWPEHIWAGTTIESQPYTWRANVLRQLPAPILWVSAEPLLSGLKLDLTRISWLVTGGESNGPADRRLVERCPCGGLPDHCIEDGCTGWALKPWALSWLQEIRDQCQMAGTRYFHKQNGGPTPKAGGRLLDGREHNEMPRVEVPA